MGAEGGGSRFSDRSGEPRARPDWDLTLPLRAPRGTHSPCASCSLIAVAPLITMVLTMHVDCLVSTAIDVLSRHPSPSRLWRLPKPIDRQFKCAITSIESGPLR